MITTVSLVIFTCEGREYLLQNTIESFKQNCDFVFDKVILAIDGKIDKSIIDIINPDTIIHQYKRKGYVKSISTTLKQIDCPYFFWLEDDWIFTRPIFIEDYLAHLDQNQHWTQVLLSKYGPLNSEQKVNKIKENFYKTNFGFSANPSICNTRHIKKAFEQLNNVPKSDKLGFDGFENYLSSKFEEQNLVNIIIDPVDHYPIKHEGYLETTDRNWHMVNSLEKRTSKYLSTMPTPSILRKLLMPLKLLLVFIKLSINLFSNSKTYEYCFRIVATSKTIDND